MTGRVGGKNSRWNALGTAKALRRPADSRSPGEKIHTLTDCPTLRSVLRLWRTPVVVWAGLGILSIAVMVWILGRWIIHGGLHSASASGYQISTENKVISWAAQVVIVVVVLTCGWFLFRASRKQGRMTFYSLLFVGYGTTFWMDPIFNWGHLRFTQNRYALNVATWGPYIPGWHSDYSGGQVESLITGGGLAYLLGFLWIAVPVAVLDLIGRRFPTWQMGRLNLFQATIIIFVTAALFDLVLETVAVRTGAYSYTGAAGPALFAGHWYQYPLSVLAYAIVLTIPAGLLIRYSRRGRQDVWILKGSDRLPERACPWMRLLAGIGFANLQILVVICVCAVTLGWAPLQSDTPSYLTPFI